LVTISSTPSIKTRTALRSFVPNSISLILISSVEKVTNEPVSSPTTDYCGEEPTRHCTPVADPAEDETFFAAVSGRTYPVATTRIRSVKDSWPHRRHIRRGSRLTIRLMIMKGHSSAGQGFNSMNPKYNFVEATDKMDIVDKAPAVA